MIAASKLTSLPSLGTGAPPAAAGTRCRRPPCCTTGPAAPPRRPGMHPGRPAPCAPHGAARPSARAAPRPRRCSRTAPHLQHSCTFKHYMASGMPSGRCCFFAWLHTTSCSSPSQCHSCSLRQGISNQQGPAKQSAGSMERRRRRTVLKVTAHAPCYLHHCDMQGQHPPSPIQVR